MANATLQSFNVFLTERLTAAAVDIYGFVEKTIIDYQDEVYRTKLENQRLQRLLDLVYKPEIRLHKADARQIDLPTPTKEVCVQKQQIQEECIPTEVKKEPCIRPNVKEELSETWTRPMEPPTSSAYSSITDTVMVRVGEHEGSELPDNLTQVVTVGQHTGYEAPGSLTQVVTVGQHTGYQVPGSLTQVVTVGEHAGYEASDSLTQVVTVGGHEYEASDSLTQVVTVGEHMEYEMPSQNDQASPSYGVSPMYTKKKDMFFCNICCQPFQKKSELKQHLLTHAPSSSSVSTNKAFKCHVCGKVTAIRSQMICHMRTHTGEKPYPCPICGKRYKLRSHIKEHMRTHTGERPYICYICGSRFNRSTTMSKHARIKHREFMPFKCKECSQCFPLLVVLKQHMKMMHNVSYSV